MTLNRFKIKQTDEATLVATVFPTGEVIGDYYTSDVVVYNDYYPYGMLMPGRTTPLNTVDAGAYRYGFNGMEADDEIKNNKGSSYDYGARMYDPRVGRWLTRDPLEKKYPSHSGYVFVLNNPIIFVDPDGKKVKPMSKEALEIIKVGLTAEEAKYVQLDKGGFIDNKLMRRGLKKMEKAGENFNALMVIVNYKEVVEVYVKDKIEYIDFNGEYQYENLGYFELTSEMEVMYELQSEAWESHGGTKEDYVSKYSDRYSTELYYQPLDGTGVLGLTSHPEEREDGAGRGTSTTENHQVTVNSKGHKEQQAATMAHELYGHMLFYILGKKDGHGRTLRIGDDGANDELEIQIRDREKEATENCNCRAKF